MRTTDPHRDLAKKFMFQKDREDFAPLDSLVKLVAFAYTEEEAYIVNHLGYVPRSADAVAKRVRRPVRELAPILKSLSDRVLISGFKDKKGEIYGFLPLVPGVFEAQIARSKGGNDDYYKEFARLFEDFYSEIGEFLKPRLEDIDPKFMRIIPIERSIERTPELKVMAVSTDRYSEMVERNNSFAVGMCPCRTATELVGKGCDKPKDVCSGMGWAADLIVEWDLGRRVSREEFIETKKRAAEAGLVNLVDNMQDPLQVCSCCGCCCGALRIANQHNIPTIVAKSHFESIIDAETCTGCETCVEWCPMGAISIENKTASVNYLRCIGCGVCVTKCEDKVIALRERKDYQPPADNLVDHAIHRYLEIKGRGREEFLSRLGLGVGRLVSKFVQHRVAGPKYKPAK